MPYKNPQRQYDSALRRAAAQRTRHSILQAARELFLKNGYDATTMAAVADAAGVAIDTVYASVGQKELLLSELIQEAIDKPLRHYQPTRQPDIPSFVHEYARFIGKVQLEVAPLLNAYRSVGTGHPENEESWNEFILFRREQTDSLGDALRDKYGLGKGADIASLLDEMWVLNSTEVYILLVNVRGWSHRKYERWLETSLSRAIQFAADEAAAKRSSSALGRSRI